MDQRHIFKGRDYQDGDFFKKQDSLMCCVLEYKCHYFIYKDIGFKYTNKKKCIQTVCLKRVEGLYHQIK